MALATTATATVTAVEVLEEEDEDRMAQKLKKCRAKWDSNVEKRLIDIWADILQVFDGQMMTRRKKEGLATQRLNTYVSEELSRPETYTEREVSNKIDTIIKKGKGMYSIHQKKGETGKEYTPEDLDLDVDAAIVCWPNFKTFFERFKEHPALGPGSVDDSTISIATASATALQEVVELDSGSSSRCQSGLSESLLDVSSASEDDDYSGDIDGDREDVTSAAKKQKNNASFRTVAKPNKKPDLEPRMKKQKGKLSAGSTVFLDGFSKIQSEIQREQQKHEQKMLQETLQFNQKLAEERIKFDMSMQQQNTTFQSSLVQQNQVFQAELFKRLFDSTPGAK